MTVADDVWMRPWLSVTGTRCTRWGPPSCFMRVHTPSPASANVTSSKPPRSDAVEPEHLELPALAGGEALVHLEQVAGEEVGLLAALGAADLDDDVAVVVRVLGQQQQLQLGLEPLDVGLGRGPSSRAKSRSSPVVSASISLAVSRSPRRRRSSAAAASDRLELVVARGGRGVARPGRPSTSGSARRASTWRNSCSSASSRRVVQRQASPLASHPGR